MAKSKGKHRKRLLLQIQSVIENDKFSLLVDGMLKR
jgi:hypothetical protein